MHDTLKLSILFTVETHVGDFSFKCDKCGKKLTSRHWFEKHKKSCHPEKYVCEFCGLQFVDKHKLLIHSNKHNTVESDDSDSDSDSETLSNQTKKLHHKRYKIGNKKSLLDNFSVYRKRFLKILEKAFSKSPIKFLISALGMISHYY